MKTMKTLFVFTIIGYLSLQSCQQGKNSDADTFAHLPQSFTLFEGDIIHNGDQQEHKNWNFNTKRETNPDIPTDWLQGGEKSLYHTGIYNFRLEIRHMERAWDFPMTMHMGWYNLPNDPDERHIATPGVQLVNLIPPTPGKPWVYELTGKIQTLDTLCMYFGSGPNAHTKVNDWDWKQTVAPNTFYTFINPRNNNLDLDGDGIITEEEFPDTECHASLTIYTPQAPEYEFLNERISNFNSLAVSDSGVPTPN